MKTPRIAFLLVLLAGAASAQQQGSTSYTPERKTDAPTFMNAEVVRVNRASNTITFRSESRETTLTVEGEALTSIGTLHSGDKVVVAYRIVKDADGREIRYVTSVTAASPTSGEPEGRNVPATQSLATITGAQPIVSGAPPVVQATGGVVVAGSTSPVLTQVPNVRSPTPVQAAVLPPAVAKEPLSADEVGVQRAQGEADLDASAVALSAGANALDVAWDGFKSQCLTGFTTEKGSPGREWYLLAQSRIPTPTDDACRALYTDLTSRAQRFMQQLDTVEDAARKADVLPVRVREVFDRHRLR